MIFNTETVLELDLYFITYIILKFESNPLNTIDIIKKILVKLSTFCLGILRISPVTYTFNILIAEITLAIIKGHKNRNKIGALSYLGLRL